MNMTFWFKKISYIPHTVILLMGISAPYMATSKPWSYGQKLTTTLKKNDPDTWLTIFVHGIMSIKPHLTLSNFMRFMRDDIENTVYSKTVDLMRQNSYFYLNQAMQGLGLQKINLFDISKGNATSAIATFYEQTTKLGGKRDDTNNHYYTFGWSGLLSPTARYQEADVLFTALLQELQIFWKQNIYPKIRLIGYSHGANVCLNLAAIRQNKYPLASLTIDELILLGCPVQTETDYLITDEIFKKIYHFYSHTDRIQRIDFFSFNRCFSRRHFQNRQRFKVPDKLTQIRLKFMRNKKSKKPNYSSFLDHNKIDVMAGTSHLLRDMSPGHMELWFFGWTPQHYRKNFVLYPLPVLVIIPYIISSLQQIEDELINPHPITVDIRPEHEIMFIKQRKRNKFFRQFPFISKNNFRKFSDTASKISPNNYTSQQYNKHVYTSFEQSQKYFEKHNVTVRYQRPYQKRRAQNRKNSTKQQLK